MNTIEIKTDLSGEKLQVLMWELEAFCEGKQLSKPVLRQHFVIPPLPSVQELREISKDRPNTFMNGALYIIDLIE